jgi:hypothetical protein
MKSTTIFLFRLSFILAFGSNIASAFVSNAHSSPITQLRASSDDGEFGTPDMADVGFVLLAGGTGSRMKASMRK